MQTRTPGHQAAAPACLKMARLILPITLAAAALPALAQQDKVAPPPAPKHSQSFMEREEDREARSVLQTYYLKNVSEPNDANEILVALRNMLDPSVKIYLVSSRQAILLKAPPEDQLATQRIIDDLTKPKPDYHLTFTLTSTEDGKRLPVEHAELDALDGQHATLKLGSKIPVLTGNYSKADDASAGVQTQFTYIDVGMNFDITPIASGPNALTLKLKVESSAVGPEKSPSPLENNPSIQQAVVATISTLTLGKPAKLGSVDLPGSNRHTEIEVVAEAR